MLKTTQWKWVTGDGLEETRSKCETSRHSMVEEGDERWRSNTHGCDGGMVFALETTRPKWETNRRAQINMFGRGQAIGLETTRLEWETGDRA